MAKINIAEVLLHSAIQIPNHGVSEQWVDGSDGRKGDRVVGLVYDTNAQILYIQPLKGSDVRPRIIPSLNLKYMIERPTE